MSVVRGPGLHGYSHPFLYLRDTLHGENFEHEKARRKRPPPKRAMSPISLAECISAWKLLNSLLYEVCKIIIGTNPMLKNTHIFVDIK